MNIRAGEEKVLTGFPAPHLERREQEIEDCVHSHRSWNQESLLRTYSLL